ncbi:hypothetical protein THIOSC13_1770031 [uncultured Thiomicrorhabdus sp.]
MSLKPPEFTVFGEIQVVNGRIITGIQQKLEFEVKQTGKLDLLRVSLTKKG